MGWSAIAGVIVAFALSGIAKLRAIVTLCFSPLIVFVLFLSFLTFWSVAQPPRLEITFYLAVISVPFSLLGILFGAILNGVRGN